MKRSLSGAYLHADISCMPMRPRKIRHGALHNVCCKVPNLKRCPRAAGKDYDGPLLRGMGAEKCRWWLSDLYTMAPVRKASQVML